eukprot:2942307-Rhodomonas_salina.1
MTHVVGAFNVLVHISSGPPQGRAFREEEGFHGTRGSAAKLSELFSAGIVGKEFQIPKLPTSGGTSFG